MKQTTKLCLTFLLATVFCSPNAYADPLVIKFAHSDADSTPRAKVANQFKLLVQQRLGDNVARVDIEVDKTIANDANLDDLVLSGKADIVAVPIRNMQKYNSRFKLFDLPFLFVTPDAAYKFVQGEYGERFIRLASQHGFTGFGFLNIGMKQFAADDIVKLPRDLRKLRVNVIGNDVVEAEMEAYRAKVSKASNEELYALLEANEIDAQENTWPALYTNKLYEFQPFMLESNHGYMGYIVLGNQTFWDEFPEDIRSVIREALTEAISLGNAIALENEQADRLNIIATKKTEIHSMTVAERRQWLNTVQPIWKAYEDTIGRELIAAAASER